MKNIVLTGATGTIGLAIIRECIKQNIEVLALVNPGSSKISKIPESPLISIKECSLEGLAAFDVTDCPKGFDAFIHLAWGATAGDAVRNLVSAQAKNVQYALDAVELAERLGCKTFVGAGSQAEYGRTDQVLTEKTEPHPETAYGMAKLCAGQMTRLACKQKGMKHIWPRILSTYGPGSQPQTIVNYTILELMAGRKPSLTGCDQIWDFIYVDDAARAMLLIADKGKDGEIYVIGSGKCQSMKNYINTIRDIVNPDIEPGFGDKPYTDTTVMHLACDITKIKDDTGFEPVVSFEDGIKYTFESVKE